MKVGFIGTGSMGSLLVEAFIRSGALEASQITVSNRSPAKPMQLSARYPGLQVAASNKDAVHGKDYVFLCIRPLEFKSVIDEIRASVQPEQAIISITSPVLLAQLEEWLPCKIAKVIPSITNQMFSGASLCMYSERMQSADRKQLETLLAHISCPLRIEEQYTRIVSDLSSCGPAFFAFFLQRFIDAAVAETGIEHPQALALGSAMLLGTARLLTEGGLSPEVLQQRVRVPGGITAKALDLLDQELEGVFNRLIRTTHAKYEEDVEKVGVSFYSQSIKGT